MIPVVSAQTMRKSDETEINRGTSGRTLMLRAGRAIANAVDFKGRTAIVCGKGNNGGDGYVIALELHEKSTLSCVLFLTKNEFSEDGKFYFDKCKEKNIPYKFVDGNTDFNGFDYVVDCIYGTGFHGKIDDFHSRLIDKINNSNAIIVSVDTNSGLNSNNGLSEKAVKSDVTVSVGTYKSGHFLGMAKDYIKSLKNVDIGIPIVGEKYYLAEENDFREFIAERKNFSHKGTYGTACIIGGCANYVGALKLAASSLSALKAGCGLSRIVAAKSLLPALAAEIKESTLFPLPDKNGEMKFNKKELSAAINGASAVAIGMGWGKGKNNRKILDFVLHNVAVPVIIDADGLNVLAENPDLIKGKNCITVLTPHVGEAARLAGKTREEISFDPVSEAKSLAKKYSSLVALKGTATVVTDGEEVIITNTGCAGMATAGSGDVLSGIMVGVLAQKPQNILLSVAYATYINGLAGELAQKEKTDISMTSGDTVTKIPAAVIFLREKANEDAKNKGV